MAEVLTQRAREILRTLVQDYIVTGERLGDDRPKGEPSGIEFVAE